MSDELTSWREALLKMPGESFLDLMRNYLGDVSTPYNKHGLISRLESFLQYPDTVEAMAEFLSPADRVVITAVMFLGDTDEKTLMRFLVHKLDADALYLAVINLEERLWLYRRASDGINVISVCPVLEGPARDFAFSPSSLFSASVVDSADPGEIHSHAADPLFAACVLSIAAKHGAKAKDAKKAPKRMQEALVALFGEGMDVARILEPFTAAGFLSVADDGFKVRSDAFGDSFTELFSDRAWAFAEAVLFPPSGYGETELNPVRSLLWSWPRNVAFDRESAVRFLSSVSWPEWQPVDPSRILDVFLSCGVLAECRVGIVSPRDDGCDIPESPFLIVSDDFSLTAFQGISWADALFISGIAVPESFGKAVKWAIDRSMVMDAFDRGSSAESIIAKLESMAATALPDPVAFAFKAWEGDRKGVTLVSLPVLVVDAKRRWMVENSPAFAGKILSTLSDGVYVLDVADPREARSLLRSAGFLHFGEAAPSRSRMRIPPDPESRHPRLPICEPRLTEADFDRRESGGVPAGSVSARTEELLDKLESLTVPEERKVLLKERIRSGVILFENQFSNPLSRFERREAKGMDFLGKVRLLEQIKSKGEDSAEISYRDSKGESVKKIVKPESVTKRGDSVVLEAKDRLSGEALSLPVERLSLVRRIKGSMFG